MSDRLGWISLESIIYDYIVEAELSESKYYKLFHLAYRCMEDLGLDFFYQIKSAKLPINSNKTVTLPSDFRKYTKLGILNGMGELVPLRYNENITTFADLSSQRIAQTETSNFVNFYSFSSPVFFNFWDGSNYSNMYGVSYEGLYGGNFKIDVNNGIILLDSNFTWDGLVLEYAANPPENEEYFVPSEFREAVISWLAWRDIINIPSSRRGNLGDKRDRRHEYFEARRRGLAKYKPFYLDQAYMVSQENTRMVVKS